MSCSTVVLEGWPPVPSDPILSCSLFSQDKVMEEFIKDFRNVAPLALGLTDQVTLTSVRVYLI